jgi:hypothetical protein
MLLNRSMTKVNSTCWLVGASKRAGCLQIRGSGHGWCQLSAASMARNELHDTMTMIVAAPRVDSEKFLCKSAIELSSTVEHKMSL